MDSLILLKTLSLTAAIIALIFIAFKLAKRFAIKHQQNPSKLLRIEEYQRIDQKSGIFLIKAGNDYFLLASGPQAMCLEKIKLE